MNFRDRLPALTKQICQTDRPGPQTIASGDEILSILQSNNEDLPLLLQCADRVRRRFHGNSIKLCAITNAASGGCGQDCAFCSQSVHHDTQISEHPLLPVESIVKSARAAEQAGAGSFSVVTSGLGPGSDDDAGKLAQLIEGISSSTGMKACMSTGIVSAKHLEMLKKAGLKRFHHNLESAKSFYPSICSTRTFMDSAKTIRDAKAAGLETCCGGIFGLGESNEQRVELIQALAELNPDAIPVNFLNPIAGTPLENQKPIAPMQALRIIAAIRFGLPAKDIILCGGREVALRDLQAFVFHAGANGLMVGDYLTTKGQSASKDLNMIRDLGLEVATS